MIFDKAIEWHWKAYEEHNPNLPYILVPEHDCLRDHPRFQELLQAMNLPYEPPDFQPKKR